MRQRIIQSAGAGRQPLTALSNSPRYTTLYSEPWDDVQAGRVQAAGAGTVDADALHARHGDNADGEIMSGRVTAGATSTGDIIHDINLPGNPIDLSAMTHVILDYFMAYADPADQARAAALRFVFSSHATNPDSDRATYYLSSAPGNPWVAPGWHRHIVDKARLGAFTGSGTWASLKSLRVRLDKAGAETYLAENTAISIDRVAFVTRTAPARPRLFLCFDDGHVNNQAASQWLDTVGIRGSFFINSKAAITGTMLAAVYEGADALEPADLLDMQARGHLIANHTHSHLEMLGGGGEFATDDEDEYVTDVLRCREWMIANGLERGADLLAAPGGNASLRKTCVEKLLGGAIRQVRLVYAESGGVIQPMQDGGYGQPNGWLDPRLPTVYSLSELEAELKAAADAAITNGATCGTLLHGTDLASTSARAGLTYWAAQRDAGLVDIVTMDQLLV